VARSRNSRRYVLLNVFLASVKFVREFKEVGRAQAGGKGYGRRSFCVRLAPGRPSKRWQVLAFRVPD
jgi:hypothetical protein